MPAEQPSFDWHRRLVFEGIVVSCRVRLARNLEGRRFPERATLEERLAVRDSVLASIDRIGALRGCEALLLEDLSEVALLELRERQLVSSELGRHGDGSAVLLDPKRSWSILVNEEDHLRIQALRTDADLLQAWTVANRLDEALEKVFDCAFDPDYGYLTACPTNVGTGLRAGVMLHLLGLRLTDEIEPVFKALDRLGLEVRGLWGEGSEGAGHLYQISNRQTLGESEREIIERLSWVAEETARQEQNARLRLLHDRPEVLLDCIARALALLRSARILYSDEALDYLAALRMGVDAGLVEGIAPGLLDHWRTMVLPGHLQGLAKGLLETEARDRLRADLMHRAMENVRLVE